MRTAHTLVVAMTLMFAAAGSPAGMTPEQESAARRPDEGIKVHGHWTIELRNPDGSIAGRHEFQNALVNQGAQVLATLLQSNSPRGLWIVQVGTATGSGPCAPGSGICLLGEAGVPFNTAGTVSVSLTSNNQALKLSGSLTAGQDGDIGVVTTNQIAGNQSFVFSQKTLPAPLHVVAGQTVAVSVVISFS
jgi:hypothetical protein